MGFRYKGLVATVAAALPFGALGGGTALAATASRTAPGYRAATVLSGQSLTHTFTTASGAPGQEHLTLPDDITVLRGIFYGSSLAP